MFVQNLIGKSIPNSICLCRLSRSSDTVNPASVHKEIHTIICHFKCGLLCLHTPQLPTICWCKDKHWMVMCYSRHRRPNEGRTRGTNWGEALWLIYCIMHQGWVGNGMRDEHTHRSGPRVYHAEDGDYTQKIEDKDGRVTHLSQQWEREGITLARRQEKQHQEQRTQWWMSVDYKFSHVILITRVDSFKFLF